MRFDTMKKNRLFQTTILSLGLLLTACGTDVPTTALQPPTADIEITLPEPEADAPTDTSEDSDALDIGSLSFAEGTTQLILVTTANTTTTDATVSYYEKVEDTWQEIFSIGGHVGVDGIGEASEYVSRTPAGLYHFTMAFGRYADPGSAIPYTQVDADDYWVDDPNSAHYNQFVSADETTVDWSSAEHLSACGDSYNYVLALDYNKSCIPGAGSAIFLHCYAGVPSQGCITIPQDYMVRLLQNISTDCAIWIGTEDSLK